MTEIIFTVRQRTVDGQWCLSFCSGERFLVHGPSPRLPLCRAQLPWTRPPVLDLPPPSTAPLPPRSPDMFSMKYGLSQLERWHLTEMPSFYELNLQMKKTLLLICLTHFCISFAVTLEKLPFYEIWYHVS